jgi:uncharacterized membrane protein
VSTDLFVTLVFVVLGLAVARLGAMMRRAPNDPALTVRNRYTEADRRVWTDASRYLGGQVIRLGLGAAALAVVLHGLTLGGRLPEQLVLAINGTVVLVGLCVLLVLHWLHARERWEYYHEVERVEKLWPAEDDGPPSS